MTAQHRHQNPDPTLARLHDWWDRGASDPTRPLLVIGGPCVLENDEMNHRIADGLRSACDAVGATFVFKASFDKANRSSIHSDRGPGIDAGLRQLAAIRERFGVPVLTAALLAGLGLLGHSAARREGGLLPALRMCARRAQAGLERLTGRPASTAQAAYS